MKKTGKNINVILGITLIVGIVLLLTGLCLGGATSAYIDSDGINFGADELYEKTIGFNDIDELKIDIGFSEIEIIESDINKVVLKGLKKYKPTVKNENKKLVVNKNNRIGINFGIFNFSNTTNSVKIYLKKDTRLKMLNIKHEFGSLKANNVNSEKLKVMNNFGEAKIKGTFNEMEVLNDFGDVTIRSSEVKDINIKNNFGDTNLNIYGIVNHYQINKDNSMGDIDVSGSYSTSGNNQNIIDIENSFGEVKVNLSN